MSRLASNTLWLTGASIAQKMLSFLYFTVIARIVGNEEVLGAYFLALVVTVAIGVLDDIGMTPMLIRDVASGARDAKMLLKNVLGWKLCMMPLTILLGVIVPPLLHFSPEATSLAYLAIAVMLADSLSLTFYGVLRGLHTVKYEAVGLFFGQVFTACLGIGALLIQAFDLRFLIAALIAGSLWNACFSAFHVVRRLGIGALVPSRSMGTLPLRLSLMFFVAALCVKIYSYVDSLTIKMVLGEGAVGIYSIAYKFAYAFQFLPMAFVGALYPLMSSQLGNAQALRKTFLDAEWYVALLAAPIVFGLGALAPEVVSLVDVQYLPAAPALQALLVGLWFIFMDFPVGSLLNASGMQAKKTFAMFIAMIVNFFANLLFVRWFGIVGAGYAAILTFALLFFLGFFFLRKILPEVTLDAWWKTVRGLTFAGACMWGSVLMVKIPLLMLHSYAWVAAIPVGAGVFFVVSWLVGAITTEHLRMGIGILRRNKYAKHSPANI